MLSANQLFDYYLRMSSTRNQQSDPSPRRTCGENSGGENGAAKRDSEVTRARILAVAEKTFAEKGFDGARVDEIAREAEVNKALIYYYFTSKEDILRHIVRGLFDQAMEVKSGMLEELDLGGASRESPELVQRYGRYLGEWIDFLEERKDVLNIVLMQSLKKSGSHGSLFSFIEESFQFGVDQYRERYNKEPKNEIEFQIQAFFMGFMPMMAFVLLRDKWCEHHQLPVGEVQETFSRIFFQEYVLDTVNRMFA